MTFVLAGLFTTAAPWQHAPRINPNYELFIGVKGRLHLELPDGQLTVGPQESLLIPPQLPLQPVTIKEVADHCGFNDEKYFSRVFKQSCGCSPSSYAGRWHQRKTDS